MKPATSTGSLVPAWTFGDRIRKARTLAKMDQREFAAAIEVTASSLAAWETERAVPRDIVAVAKRVEMLTDIPAAWILGVEPPVPFDYSPSSNERVVGGLLNNSDDQAPNQPVSQMAA